MACASVNACTPKMPFGVMRKQSSLHTGSNAMQVEAMLTQQAVHAKAFINESIEMLLGYHNTFNGRYSSTCDSILHDCESFKGQGSKSLEELKANLGFASLAEPFMMTLFPIVKELGGMAVNTHLPCPAMYCKASCCTKLANASASMDAVQILAKLLACRVYLQL